MIALDPLFKTLATAPLPGNTQPLTAAQWRARTRVELEAALNIVEARPLDTWGSGTAADLAEIIALGRVALDQAPDYHQTYAFVVAWRSAVPIITRDHDEAQAYLVQLERRVR